MSDVNCLRFIMNVANCELCQSNAVQLIHSTIGLLVRCCGCGRVSTIPDSRGRANVIIEQSAALDPIVINERGKPQ